MDRQQDEGDDDARQDRRGEQERDDGVDVALLPAATAGRHASSSAVSGSMWSSHDCSS